MLQIQSVWLIDNIVISVLDTIESTTLIDRLMVAHMRDKCTWRVLIFSDILCGHYLEPKFVNRTQVHPRCYRCSFAHARIITRARLGNEKE